MRRYAFIAHRLPRALRQVVSEWRILQSSARLDVMGFDVRLYALGAANADVARRLQEALSLIREKDPRRFARMQRDLRHIVVKPTQGAFYWILSNTCVLESPEILARSPAILALTVIHEATHARLTNAGIYPSAATVQRIEERCIAEERSFTILLRQAGYSGTERLLAWLDSCVKTKAVMTGRGQ